MNTRTPSIVALALALASCRSLPDGSVAPYPEGPIGSLQLLSTRGVNEQGYVEYASDVDPSVVFVYVPGGNFHRGSWEGPSTEEPPHPVQLSSYLIAKHEITNAQFARYCQAQGLDAPPAPHFADLPRYYRNQPDCPVVNVDYESARAYCAWLGAELPTEAQWEFAARGVDHRPYPWGGELPLEGGLVRANYSGYENGRDWRPLGEESRASWARDGHLHPGPVEAFEAGVSPFGLLGQAGNVAEWCRDWFAPYGEEALCDPCVEEPGELEERCVRGGAFDHHARALRASARGHLAPATISKLVGFRPVIELR